MAQQTINVGTSPNDGTGTPLRTAFQYTNSNFSELYTAVGPSGNNIVVPGTATISGALDAARLNVTAATIPANGVYLASGNNLTFAFNSTLGMSLNAGGLLVNNTTGFNSVANIKLKVGGRFLSGISGIGAYSFGTADAGGFVINDAGDGTTESRLLTLNSTGLGVGVTPSGPGGCLQLKSGITFPATQVASSDVNTLDDYEEGSWVPTLNSGTFSSASCRYTKVGNMVTVFFDVTVGTGGGSQITNLPFTAAATSTVASGIYTNNQTYAAGTTAPVAVVGGSSSTLFFRTVGTGVAFSAMSLTAGANLTGSISYFV